MNDEARIPAGAPHDLRTVTNRLTDLQRKCRSVGSRNQDADEMDARIASILERLTPTEDGDVSEIPFAVLARELYAVERFFESSGFITVAKEVAHVERTLEAMAPDTTPTAPAPPQPSRPEPDPAERELIRESEPEQPEPVQRWAVPRPVAAILALFVIAVAVCVGVIWTFTRDVQPAPDGAGAAAQQTALPAPPTATPAPRPVATSSEPAPGAILAESIGNARLALANGDLEVAMDELSRAALIDSDHRTVLETANHIVIQLIQRADTAAEGGLWEIAELTLARSERIAQRFGLDTTPILESRRRHSRMDRFQLLKPDERQAIAAAAGRRVTVFFGNGSSRESIIQGIEGGDLLLDEDTEVRGGAMYYTDRIPLDEIDHLMVWED
jgi:hypothetical protein